MNFGELVIPGICGMGLHLELDGFRLVYLLMAVLMWTVSGVFSKEYMAHYDNKKRYYLFFWLTFFATVGVFLSADLYTTFIFFEIISFTSYVWVAFDEKPESLRAANTYLAVAVIGGLVMLMGLFLLNHLLGTLTIDDLYSAAAAFPKENRKWLYIAGGLILFGFGAKAGCFPLHIWLPKAHPVAPAPASALLSGILTKTGVFGVIIISTRIFAGDHAWGILITVLGVITMFLGAVLGVFSVNLKRTLACSSVSQIGFIFVGIGMCVLILAAGEEPATAARGVFLHMVNHSLFKLLLFLCAGAVFMNLHKLDLNEVRGFGRGKPLLLFCFSMGALGISGVPLWSGYVSKTLLHESIVEYQGLAANPVIWVIVEWIFLISGGMTFAYMLKLFKVLFIDEPSEEVKESAEAHKGKKYMTRLSGAVLTVPAVLIVLFGFFPNVFMDRIADLGQGFFLIEEGPEEVMRYFSLGNLKGSLISLTIGALIFIFVVRKVTIRDGKYVDVWPKWLDLENLIYRPLLLNILPGIFGFLMSLADTPIEKLTNLLTAVAGFFCGIADSLVEKLVPVFTAVSTFFCRIADSLVEKLVPILTTDSTFFSRIGDSLADALILLARKTTHRQKKEEDRSLEITEEQETFLERGEMVEELFSFGLLLFGLGLCFTLGYLLYMLFRM